MQLLPVRRKNVHGSLCYREIVNPFATPCSATTVPPSKSMLTSNRSSFRALSIATIKPSSRLVVMMLSIVSRILRHARGQATLQISDRSTTNIRLLNSIVVALLLNCKLKLKLVHVSWVIEVKHVAAHTVDDFGSCLLPRKSIGVHHNSAFRSHILLCRGSTSYNPGDCCRSTQAGCLRLHLLHEDSSTEANCQINCIRWSGIHNDLLCRRSSSPGLEVVNAAVICIPNQRSDACLRHLAKEATLVSGA